MSKRERKKEAEALDRIRHQVSTNVLDLYWALNEVQGFLEAIRMMAETLDGPESKLAPDAFRTVAEAAIARCETTLSLCSTTVDMSRSKSLAQFSAREAERAAKAQAA